VPEQIGNGEKARDWAEKIARNSQIKSPNSSRIILPERGHPLMSLALASSRTPISQAESIQYANSGATIKENNSIFRAPDPRASQEDPFSQSKPGLNSAHKINPVEVANKVYRLMQNDLLLQIERAGN
jgi:hypothetical protein